MNLVAPFLLEHGVYIHKINSKEVISRCPLRNRLEDIRLQVGVYVSTIGTDDEMNIQCVAQYD